jgi:glucose/arabinose dehydrogenase
MDCERTGRVNSLPGVAARRRASRLLEWPVTGGASLLVAAVLAGSAPAGETAHAAVTIRVAAKDFSFTLSQRSVPAGTTVRFVVRNRGSAVHDFAVAGTRTKLLRHGQTQTITVRFPRKRSIRFLCTVPGHARLGMTGVFSVGKPATSPQPSSPPTVPIGDTVELTKIGTFDRPVLVTAPAGDSRLFVVEQTGTIRVISEDGHVLPQPFLDIRDRVHISSEPGLLGLAFAPDYATSGLAYVFYNSRSGNGDLVLAEYRRDATNPNLLEPYTWRTVLTIVKPWENHNGGMLQFGPDGDLYVSVGDGDSGILDLPGRFAQSRDELLGDILRIDPRGAIPYAVPRDNPFVGVDGVRPEIWAYGLRNPWRFWIDDVTGDTFIGDAGEGQREEIDLVPKGASGLDFGWPCFEGTLPFDTTAACIDPVPPLVDIPHSPDVCAVIGGVTVHDSRLPGLAGRYLYGDFCGGHVMAAKIEEGTVSASDHLGLAVPELTSFGVDGIGRLYLTSLDGSVYRLDPRE